MKCRYREPHEMKESGVEWLGLIPREWEVSKINQQFIVRSEKVSDTEYPPLSVSKNGIVPQMESVAKTDNNDNRKKVCINDFVINSRADRKGSCGTSKLEGSVSLISHVLKPLSTIEPHYVHYLFRNYYFSEEFFRWGTGIVSDLWSTNIERMKKINIPALSLIEQKKIADFLDLKCSQFDSIIEKKESLIKKLVEAKKSLISEVVTGKVKVVEKADGSYEVIKREEDEMRDSGVEWLGMVPREWEVKKIKHLSPIGRGASPRPIDDPKYFEENGEYAWTRIADVTLSEKYLLETTQKMSKLGASLSVKLEPGNIFISIAGSVGKPCITGIKACIHDGFVYFHKLDKKYQDFLYNIFLIGQCYAGLGKLGTQLNLNRETIGNIFIALPLDDSEERISKYVNIKCSQFDSTIEKQKQVIEKLKLAKQSLISEVVTGKIEVL